MGSPASSQDSTIALSRFELFAGKPNTLLRTEIMEAGSLGWRNLYVLKATDLASGASASAIRLRVYLMGTMPVLIEPGALIIDLSELSTVIEALERMQAETLKPRPSSDLHFSYATSTDIVFSCSYDRQNDTWQYAAGKVYKNLRTYVPGTMETFTKRRFTELVALLKKVQASSW
jgi:hypothetical protein